MKLAQKRLHSLSPQDKPPGELNQYQMPRKKQVIENSALSTRVTRSALASVSATTVGTAESALGQARKGEVVSMASLINKVSCGLCGTDVSDESITCVLCSKSYHPTTVCTGLKPMTIQCLREEEESAISYTCTSCRCSPSRVSSSPGAGNNGEWNIAVGQVLEIVKCLASNMSQLSTTVNRLLEDKEAATVQAHASDRIMPAISETVVSKQDLYTEMWEFEERKKRQNSVIVRGTGCNTIDEFSDKFRLILQFLLQSNPRIASTHCICPDKKIFRVTFVDKATKVNLLTAAPNLMSSPDYKRTFISRDLTYAQRQAAARTRASKRAQQQGESSHSQTDQPPHPPLRGANTEPLGASSSTVRTGDPPPPASGGGGSASSFQ